MPTNREGATTDLAGGGASPGGLAPGRQGPSSWTLPSKVRDELGIGTPSEKASRTFNTLIAEGVVRKLNVGRAARYSHA